ncbi:hypothetical protein [Pseudanabaena yagii]|uniref:Uncharacterized protein n=1 Tax=Pseudanabaena yagii GIHE-NHR1 TaxID=2722753 RepID=A0ABX1LXC6_9CYAN|nr:hypothetical protein [Pseudanabaena yagii]NMF60814.1 hypothetical protein [Pseudanabaena yagii GIHE-NHR1]
MPTYVTHAIARLFDPQLPEFSVLAFSPYPLLRITKRSLLSNLPHLCLMIGLTALFFKLMM